MLYMKEMRAKVVAECTLKESAAINQILGRRVSKPYALIYYFLSSFPVNYSASELPMNLNVPISIQCINFIVMNHFYAEYIISLMCKSAAYIR